METDSVARLMREAELLGGLDSPHIIRLLDSGWEAGAFFLVLDYHPAGSLARWLDHRFVLQLSTAIDVTAASCSGRWPICTSGWSGPSSTGT